MKNDSGHNEIDDDWTLHQRGEHRFLMAMVFLIWRDDGCNGYILHMMDFSGWL